jgi:hypothetical protein
MESSKKKSKVLTNEKSNIKSIFQKTKYKTETSPKAH